MAKLSKGQSLHAKGHWAFKLKTWSRRWYCYVGLAASAIPLITVVPTFLLGLALTKVMLSSLIHPSSTGKNSNPPPLEKICNYATEQHK